MAAILMRRSVAAAASASTRGFSAAAASVQIDWSAVRSKMMTDETRAEADRAREAFEKRLSAAQAVGPVAELDWAAYAKALPEVDVAAMQRDFAAAEAAAKPVAYDAAADAAAHAAKEAGWTGFANYCAARIGELKALQEEQGKHKLHRWYRRRQLYARFPGLYESLHHKVRGEWDVALWGSYIAYKAKAQPLPWDPSFGEVDDQKRRELMLAISAKAGVKPEALGFTLPAEAKAAPPAPAKAAHH